MACCKALNLLLGRMSLKEKLRVVLNQKGEFRCPNGRASCESAQAPAVNSGLALPADSTAAVVSDLRRRGSARPRAVKTLAGTVAALFKRSLSEQEIAALLSHMLAEGLITVEGTKVSYDLPRRWRLTSRSRRTKASCHALCLGKAHGSSPLWLSSVVRRQKCERGRLPSACG